MVKAGTSRRDDRTTVFMVTVVVEFILKDKDIFSFLPTEICHERECHCNDVIMRAMASQITSLAIVYSTIYFRCWSKKTSKLRVTGLCAENSPVTGEFLAQMASNGENVSIWWRHHAMVVDRLARKGSILSRYVGFSTTKVKRVHCSHTSSGESWQRAGEICPHVILFEGMGNEGRA